jgi:hypothetical protein
MHCLRSVIEVRDYMYVLEALHIHTPANCSTRILRELSCSPCRSSQRITNVTVSCITPITNNTTYERVYRAKRRRNRMKTSFWMLDQVRGWGTMSAIESLWIITSPYDRDQ